MIGQYLTNKNENATVSKFKKKIEYKQGLSEILEPKV
jgi:hypothetical protein